MPRVEAFIDPSCPWTWITSRWLKEVASERDLAVTWRPYSTEIRDNYGVPPGVPPELQDVVAAAHAIAHRMLRIFEAVRTRAGEEYVDPLYNEWGRRFFVEGTTHPDHLFAECLEARGLAPDLLGAADDEQWDTQIVEAMEVAHTFGGSDTQSPTIAVYDDPPHGFKGPVMSPAPTGEAALKLWDAIQVLSKDVGFFELTRPRSSQPMPAVLEYYDIRDQAANRRK